MSDTAESAEHVAKEKGERSQSRRMGRQQVDFEVTAAANLIADPEFFSMRTIAEIVGVHRNTLYNRARTDKALAAALEVRKQRKVSRPSR